MRRTLFFLYGLVAYALFFVVFLYAIGFVAGMMVPRTVDAGGAAASTSTTLAIDAALLTIFALQHSIMARQGFKRWWTTIVPQPIERSTYVLLSSAALALIFAFWRPLPQVVWHVENPIGAAVLWGLFAFGWLVVLLSTFMIGHFDLFGLRQVWSTLRGRMLAPDHFRMPAFYRIVRHPIMVGFLIAFWATPTMTVGHLFFAVATTGYILIAVQLEERDLITYFGDTYREYRARVPGFIPFTGGSRSGAVAMGAQSTSSSKRAP